jgi:hypothetical protein
MSGRDRLTAPNLLHGSGLIVTTESIQQWTRELSKLNVRRTTPPLTALKVKEEVIQLVQDLGYFDETSQDEIVLHTVEAATYTVKMAIDIIIKDTANNPPGSGKWLSALEHILIGLLTVQFERDNTTKHLTAPMNLIGDSIKVQIFRRKDNLVSIFDCLTTSINQFLKKEKGIELCAEQSK